jgi:hypothetical protein
MHIGPHKNRIPPRQHLRRPPNQLRPSRLRFHWGFWDQSQFQSGCLLPGCSVQAPSFVNKMTTTAGRFGPYAELPPSLSRWWLEFIPITPIHRSHHAPAPLRRSPHLPNPTLRVPRLEPQRRGLQSERPWGEANGSIRQLIRPSHNNDSLLWSNHHRTNYSFPKWREPHLQASLALDHA